MTRLWPIAPPRCLDHFDDSLVADLRGAVDAVAEAVDPERLVAQRLRRRSDGLHIGPHRYPLGRGRVWLLAAGKAARPMATAAERALGDRLAGGLVVTKPLASGDESLPGCLKVMVADHPVPSPRSAAAGQAALSLVQQAGEDDLVVVLLSGGASSLLVAPRPGVGLEKLIDTGRRLVTSGWPIARINEARAQLDAIKAGGLTRAAAPTRVVTLVLSDVVDAPLSTVGSGPTMGDPLVELATNQTAVRAAAKYLAARGWAVKSWPPLCGEAAVLGRPLGQKLAAPVARPTAWVTGGETTVTVRGGGTGGRCQELTLSAALALHEAAPSIEPRLLLALATDGEDGPSNTAGAAVDRSSITRAHALGLDPAAALIDNDAAPVFAALGDAWITGPTQTNVCDLAIALAVP